MTGVSNDTLEDFGFSLLIYIPKAAIRILKMLNDRHKFKSEERITKFHKQFVKLNSEFKETESWQGWVQQQ